MIRKADPSDTVAIAAFLDRHAETSMFLLGNLEAQGIGNTDHPYGTSYFLRETGDGITGVFGCTNNGMLLCQLPGLSVTEAQTYAHLLQGYTLHGMTGDAAQVGLILDALPLPGAQWALNRDDPLYRIALPADVSEAPLRKAEEADIPLLTEWMERYLIETATAPAEGAASAAPRHARMAVASGRVRLLIEDGQPVAMAGVNARAGTAIQIGGVYVPADLRGKGRSARAVAGLLHEEAATGAERAILFAASPQAAKVYESIGFERVGDYRVALLAQPVTLGPPT